MSTNHYILMPALHGFQGLEGVWVQLKDIAQMLNMSPTDVWKTYFCLSQTGNSLSIVYSSAGSHVRWEAGIAGRDFRQHSKAVFGSTAAFMLVLDNGDFYVPETWARKVITAHNHNEVPYEHPIYKTGTQVRILRALHSIHPASGIAGLDLIACYGTWNPAKENEHFCEDFVPVRVNDEIVYVEVAYVLKS